MIFQLSFRIVHVWLPASLRSPALQGRASQSRAVMCQMALPTVSS